MLVVGDRSVLMGRSVEVGHFVGGLQFVAGQSDLIERLLQFYLVVGSLSDIGVFSVHLEGARTQTLFFVLVCNHFMVMLHSVRNVRVVRDLLFLHSGQESSVVSL